MTTTPRPGWHTDEDTDDLDDGAFTVTVRPIYEDELDDYVDDLEAGREPRDLQPPR